MKNVNWQAIYNHLCFFNIKELVTNLLYIFHILITPSAIIGIWKYDHLGLGYISSMVEIKRMQYNILYFLYSLVLLGKYLQLETKT